MATTTFNKVKNRAISSLASNISSSDLTLTVLTGEGALFPSVYPFHITIDDEILSCTNRSTDTFTVTRAAEGTTAASHLADVPVSLNITAALVTEMQTVINNLEGRVDSLEAETAPSFVCTVRNGSDVAYASPSGSRAVDTQYKNSSGLARMVYVFGGGGSATDIYLTAKIGSASANQTVALIRTASSTEKDSMSFIVPSDYYYKCTQSGGTFGIATWVETDIGLSS